MGRSLRPQIPGGIYHVTARGNRRHRIYRTDFDYRLFLNVLSPVVAQLEWRCHLYCLMPNHYHLVVETPNPDLSRGMHRLNSAYAHAFNERYGVVGHLFEARFGAVLVQTSEHLLELARYVLLNPVRARLCSDPAEWPWSSYRAMVGIEKPERFLTTDWIASQFGVSEDRARHRFAQFIEDGSPVAGSAA